MKEIVNKEEHYEWKCMEITEPSDFEKFVENNNIIGRKVVGMKFVGINFDNFRYNTQVLQSVEIDEPFMFKFEDGSHWDINYSSDNCIYTGINALPEKTKSCIGSKKDVIKAEKIFSDIYQTTITNITINHIPVQEYEEYIYEPSEDQKECFNEIKIEFSNGCVISLTICWDYGWIMLIKPLNGILPKYQLRYLDINLGRRKYKYIRGNTYKLYVNININKNDISKGRIPHSRDKAKYLIVGDFLYRMHNIFRFGNVAVFEIKDKKDI